MRPRRAHGLMMRRIDVHRRGPHDPVQQRPRRHRNRMPRLMPRVGLLMRQCIGHAGRDMLDQCPPQRHRQQLLPAANPQHRHVPGERPLHQRQFRLRPPRLQRHRAMHRPVAIQRGIDIERPSGDNQRIKPVKILARQFRMMRQRQRQPARRRNRARIVGAQRIPRIF